MMTMQPIESLKTGLLSRARVRGNSPALQAGILNLGNKLGNVPIFPGMNNWKQLSRPLGAGISERPRPCSARLRKEYDVLITAMR